MKKIFIVIGIILILVIFCGFFVSNFLSQDQIEIGNTTFKLPKGYHKGIQNKFGDVNITNGSNSVFISTSKGNISDKINGYENYASKNNNSVIISNFSINSVIVYKAINVNDTNFIRYWFKNNDTVYTVYTWSENQDIDDIVSELIKSIKN